MALSREKKRELVELLHSAGCCDRCVLRFLKVYLPSSYRNASATVEAMTHGPSACGSGQESTEDVPEESVEDDCTDATPTTAECSATLQAASAITASSDQNETCASNDEDDEVEPPTKRKRVSATGIQESSTDTASCELGSYDVAVEGELDQAKASNPDSTTADVCSSCLGILQDSWIDDMIGQVHQKVNDEGYEFSSFTFSISFPLSSLVRERALLAVIGSEFKTNDGVPLVKEVLKWVASPPMQERLDVRFAMNSPFQIAISVEHAEAEGLSETLLKQCPQHFKVSRKSRLKQTADPVNITSVMKAMQSASDEDMKSWFSCPLPKPEACAQLSSISCQHSSMYIAGRYCKYSRALSQTPWVIDGKRKTELSVQEIICNSLQAEAHAADLKFCSSGREDVDVRMLGRGRPFCVELVDPKRTVISQDRVTELQLAINNSSKIVQVQDLQVIDKTGVERMKEGEADKIKHYSALIHIPSGVNSVELTSLTSIKELCILQKTPIRVLHRRTLMDRKRTIHAMSAEVVDDYHFRLLLSSQAGTYIKEFVHGDLGRTVPSVGMLLKVPADILELDVTAVDLDWPPAIG